VGLARELVRGLRDNLADELLSDDFAAWNTENVSIIGCVQFTYNFAGIPGRKRTLAPPRTFPAFP
jgi:hypothetical protein